MNVVDAHVNVASTLAIPEEFIHDQAANVYARLAAMGEPAKPQRVTDLVFSHYQDDLADTLVREMDAAGVEQAVLLAPDFSLVAKCRLTPEELAAHHHRIAQRHPGRFRVLWGVDPRHGDDALALFERCVTDYGFEGLKLYPLCGYSPSDPLLYPYYEICAERGLPVLCHTGPGWQSLDFEYGRPLLIDGAARDFPQVSFILAHGGVTYVEETSYLCGFRPNVYLDISGFVAVVSPDGWQRHLNTLFRSGLNHKIVFGTSWPAFKMSTTLKAVLAEFGESGTVFDGIKPSHRRLVMAGNLERILPPHPTPPDGTR